MLERREKERAELESKANYLLEHPDLLPDCEHLRQFALSFRLWRYPAFESYVSWIVYQKNDLQSVVRKVVWNRIADLTRLSNPLEGLKSGFHTNPKLDIKDARLSGEQLQNHIDELQSLSIPAFIKDNRIVLDGVIFGIESSRSMTTCRISWWHNPPEEWSAVAEWFKNMTAFLDSHFSD